MWTNPDGHFLIGSKGWQCLAMANLTGFSYLQVTSGMAAVSLVGTDVESSCPEMKRFREILDPIPFHPVSNPYCEQARTIMVAESTVQEVILRLHDALFCQPETELFSQGG